MKAPGSPEREGLVGGEAELLHGLTLLLQGQGGQAVAEQNTTGSMEELNRF